MFPSEYKIIYNQPSIRGRGANLNVINILLSLLHSVLEYDSAVSLTFPVTKRPNDQAESLAVTV